MPTWTDICETLILAMFKGKHESEENEGVKKTLRAMAAAADKKDIK